MVDPPDSDAEYKKLGTGKDRLHPIKHPSPRGKPPIFTEYYGK